jgi:hypothetical protein
MHDHAKPHVAVTVSAPECSVTPRIVSPGRPRDAGIGMLRGRWARPPALALAACGSRTLTTLPEMLPAASQTRAHTCCGRLGAYHTALPVVGYGCHHAPEKSLLALNCTSRRQPRHVDAPHRRRVQRRHGRVMSPRSW